MKLRTSKKSLKRLMRLNGLEPLRVTGKVFVFVPRRPWVCVRWGSFVASSADNPRLNELLGGREVMGR